MHSCSLLLFSYFQNFSLLLYFTHFALFPCCILFMFGYFQCSLFSCFTLFLLHFFLFTLSSCCTLSRLHLHCIKLCLFFYCFSQFWYFFRAARLACFTFFVSLFLFMYSYFYVAFSSCCTLCMLHFFHVALFLCCTIFMLLFSPFCTIVMLFFSRAALFSCCSFPRAALLSCCSFPVLHYFHASFLCCTLFILISSHVADLNKISKWTFWWKIMFNSDQ